MSGPLRKAAQGLVLDHDVSAGPVLDDTAPGIKPVFGGGNSPGGERQRDMEVAQVENVLKTFGHVDALDLTLTGRAVSVLAVLQLHVVGEWIGVVALQLELEDHGVEIPMASLYPLLERLLAIGFIAKRDEPGPKGRPRAFYHITHTGRHAVSLANAVAKSKDPLKAGCHA